MAWDIDKGENERHIPKTLLQSTNLKEEEGLVYRKSLKDTVDKHDEILKSPTDSVPEEVIQAYFEDINKTI